VLFGAMQRPMAELGARPERPGCVVFEDQVLAEALAPALAALGIVTEWREAPNFVDALLRTLEAQMGQTAAPPGGLLEQAGVTPEMTAGLFAAAADFYRAAPWRVLSSEMVLAARVLPRRKPAYLIVLGRGGAERGLAWYRTLEDVERMLTAYERPEDAIPPDGAHVLTFASQDDMPFEDVDAAQAHGWEVAGEDAYPLPVILLPESADPVRRPGAEEVLWYQAVLRALAALARERPAGPLFLEDEVRVPAQTSAGPVTVAVKSVIAREEESPPPAPPPPRKAGGTRVKRNK
jgi:hypothetical protein